MRPFTLVKDHVLLRHATQLETVDIAFHSILTNNRIRAIVGLIPDDWLNDDTSFQSTDERRKMYVQFLETRLANSTIFVKEAQHAANALI